MRNSYGNAFLRSQDEKGKLTLKVLTFIASPMLEILSQTEIKLNWLPVILFQVCMHGIGLTFIKPSVRKQYKRLGII